MTNGYEFSPINHNQIFDELLGKIKLVDFHALAGLKPDATPSTAQLLIITIEHILQLALDNSWGICRNLDFIYLYNGSYWSLVGEEELKAFLGKVAEKMGVDHFKAKHYVFRDQLFKQFMTLANLPKPEYPKDSIYINLLNGTFEITSNGNMLRGFNSSDFITYQLPFAYDLAATAPLFMQYLNRVLPDHQRQLILAEYLGYIFIPTHVLKLEKALLLYGTGANGKSVFYEIVRSLLGAHNTSEYSLQSLTNDNGYYRAMIANKLVNYASEIDGRLEASFFKQLVSGESVEARLPYGNPFTIDRYAKLIFNCNELPKEVEQTEAFFRRFLIVPFDETIPEEEQDKQLARKIIASELSGVFNWVLAGLERLINHKQFTHCEAVVQARKQYELESDSVKMFLHENGYVASDTGYIALQDLYEKYKQFCHNDGYRQVNLRNFGKRLRACGIGFGRRNFGKTVLVVKLLTDYENVCI